MSSSSRGMGRLTVGALLVLALWLLVGCAGSPQQSAPPITGTFVGKAPETDAFVAILAADPEQVRAYLCDGKREPLSEWFTGRAEGNDLQLTSESGAKLDAQLADEAATGTITLADGESIPFDTVPATGVGGLYDVALSEGVLSGSSELGGRLEGEVVNGPREDGSYLIPGIITGPDGQEQDFNAEASTQEAIEGRFIVLNDGQFRGAKKKGSGAGFFINGGNGGNG